ncbi:hypothetical protein CPB86DRAFT_819139 [Serendipita vermifera]|nr:hypothetical protein CPB86DRAFT_819139 [Serendipita vermifera]
MRNHTNEPKPVSIESVIPGLTGEALKKIQLAGWLVDLIILGIGYHKQEETEWHKVLEFQERFLYEMGDQHRNFELFCGCHYATYLNSKQVLEEDNKELQKILKQLSHSENWRSLLNNCPHPDARAFQDNLELEDTVHLGASGGSANLVGGSQSICKST